MRTLTPPQSNLNDEDILARTMYGEARNQGIDGMTAVACVVFNRLAVAVQHPGFSGWPRTIAGICLQHEQFSCWNTNDPNYQKIIHVGEEDAQFLSCQRLAKAFCEKGVTDITGGATHYHTRGVSPGWGKVANITANIGDEVFYRPDGVPA